jgi:hypothetical protein
MEMRGIYKKINSIRPASYKFVRKAGIMQGNLPTEQVSNRMTQNNRNRNNQPAAAEEVSAEEFHYEELTHSKWPHCIKKDEHNI